MKKLKPNKWADKEVTAYQEGDLTAFAEVIDKAKAVWRAACVDYVKAHGDVGSCVLGAGVQVYFLPPKARKPILRTIIAAHDVAAAQGSVTWEASKDEVLSILRQGGLEVTYAWGNMD